MVEGHDLNRGGKVLLSDVPDPLGSIADDYFLRSTTPAPFPGFRVEAMAKLLSRFHRSGIGRGGFVAHRPAPLIASRLSKYATQLPLARARGLSFDPASTAFSF